MSADKATFERMSSQQAASKAAGEWGNAGPTDLLTIIGKQRGEVVHCAALAWLMNPAGRHGLGAELLAAVLREALSREPFSPAALAGAAVETEVTRQEGGKETRADIVVYAPGLTVVFEAKINAPEHPGQCEELYQHWKDHEGVRFVFLTPSGRWPYTAISPEAKLAWRHGLRFGAVLQHLERLAPRSDGAPGAAAVSTYLQTLRQEFPSGRVTMSLDPRVKFYLEHEAQIEEWHLLRKQMHAEAHSFFSSLAPSVQALADKLGVWAYINAEEPYPKLFLYRAPWYDPEPKPHGRIRVAVGIEWHRKKATFHGSYSGLWVDPTLPGSDELKARLRALNKLPPGFYPTDWWPAWKGTAPPDRYWEDLDGFRQEMLERLQRRWDALSPLVDAAFADLARE